MTLKAILLCNKQYIFTNEPLSLSLRGQFYMYLFFSYVTNALLASGNNDNLVKAIEHMKSKYSMRILVPSSGLERQIHVFHLQQLICSYQGYDTW